MVYEREDWRMIGNVQWLQAPRKHRAVNERVDVYMTIKRSAKRSDGKVYEYLVIRIFKEKYQRLFGDTGYVNIGFLGNYMIVEKGDMHGFKVIETVSNPEIRVSVDALLAMDKDPVELEGQYLINWDKSAGQAYIDLTRKATV